MKFFSEATISGRSTSSRETLGLLVVFSPKFNPDLQPPSFTPSTHPASEFVACSLQKKKAMPSCKEDAACSSPICTEDEQGTTGQSHSFGLLDCLSCAPHSSIMPRLLSRLGSSASLDWAVAPIERLDCLNHAIVKAVAGIARCC